MPVGSRKFYDISSYQNVQENNESTQHCEKTQSLFCYIRSNILGFNESFLTPFGARTGLLPLVKTSF